MAERSGSSGEDRSGRYPPGTSGASILTASTETPGADRTFFSPLLFRFVRTTKASTPRDPDTRQTAARDDRGPYSKDTYDSAKTATVTNRQKKIVLWIVIGVLAAAFLAADVLYYLM